MDLELSKLNLTTQQAEKEKFYNKSINLLKEAKESELNYINLLTATNETQNFFINESKNNLKNFQLLDTSFYEFSKETLRKYSIYTKTDVKNELHDIERLSEVNILFLS